MHSNSQRRESSAAGAGGPLQRSSSAASSVTSSPPPLPHVTKKRVLRRENWELHRDTIKRLYIDEGKKLSEIMEIMRRDYGLNANARMYKHRLSQWGFIKYNRVVDVQQIMLLKSQREAEGKDSQIELNGRVVDFDRVEKYLQRRKISFDERQQQIQGQSQPQQQLPSPPRTQQPFPAMQQLPYRSRQPLQYDADHETENDTDESVQGTDASALDGLELDLDPNILLNLDMNIDPALALDPHSSSLAASGFVIRTPPPSSYSPAVTSAMPVVVPQLVAAAPGIHSPPDTLKQPPSTTADEVLWLTRAYAEMTTPGSVELSSHGFAFLDSVLMIHELMEQRRPNEAGMYMQQASGQLKDLMTLQLQEAGLCVFEAVLVLTPLAPEVATMLVRHAADLAAIYFQPETNPLRGLLSRLAGIATDSTSKANSPKGTAATTTTELEQLVTRAFRCHLQAWEARLGRGDEGCVYWWMRFLRARNSREAAADETIPTLEQEAERLIRGGSESQQQQQQQPLAMEKLHTLAMYECRHAQSRASAYARHEALVRAYISRSAAQGRVFAKAHLEFGMARVARAAGRSADAAAYGQAAVSSYMGVGKADMAANVRAWIASGLEDAPVLSWDLPFRSA